MTCRHLVHACCLPHAQDVVFPLFDQVKPQHVVPGIRALLGQLHKDVDGLEASVTPTWAGLVEPLERLTHRHQLTWGTVTHLQVRHKQTFDLGEGCMHGGRTVVLPTCAHTVAHASQQCGCCTVTSDCEPLDGACTHPTSQLPLC